MAMHDSIGERLTELETRLAFVDDTVASLSDTLAVQGRRVQEILLAMARLSGDLAAAQAALAHDVHDEPPPPHY